MYSITKQFDKEGELDHQTGNLIRVHRSTDHGVTWDTQGHVLTDFDNHPDGYWSQDDYYMLNTRILADPASSNVWAFYVDFENRICGDPGPSRRVAVLYCAKSTDHGVTWNTPVSILSDSIYSTIPCSPANFGKLRDDNGAYVREGYFRIGRVWACRDTAAGRIHVVWMDNREGKHPDPLTYANQDYWRVYRSYSSDGGTTWSSAVLTVSLALSLGGYGNPNGSEPEIPPGDHLGCAADSQYLYVTWPDSRNFSLIPITDPVPIYFRRFSLPY